MEQKSLAAFYQTLPVELLPLSIRIRGVSCLFLDSSGPGNGGPNFRMGDSQLHWFNRELKTASVNGERVIIFMHTYPDDFTDKQETRVVNDLLAQHDVVLVDMGHTHYNELASDGHVIFSATRSTGQIEEGPVGYSLISIDNGQVSWRFKSLHDAFPFVLITSPADYRLRRNETLPPLGITEAHAVVFGASALQRVAYRLNTNEWVPMVRSDDQRSWLTAIEVPPADPLELTVEAIDASGRPGRHTLQLARPGQQTPKRMKNGSDADSIGAWPENGIFGTQLGPNRNGKPSA